jgi:hypothetical protein
MGKHLSVVYRDGVFVYPKEWGNDPCTAHYCYWPECKKLGCTKPTNLNLPDDESPSSSQAQDTTLSR